MSSNVEPIAALLRRAERVVALTGAGISAESGVPTFRQAQTGLWEQFSPEELATPEAFARDPELIWRWYAWRRRLCEHAQPNAAHLALVELALRVRVVTVLTQNVDNLHQRAGSLVVVELHGNLFRARCVSEDLVFPEWNAEALPPRCPSCGDLLRPDVVWFGETLPRAALATALDAAEQCDVFLSIGTSGVVYPAAALLPRAHSAGAAVVVINPDPEAEAGVPGAQRLVAPAAEVLPALVQAAWPEGD